MRKIPPHIQEYLDKSPYGPFSEFEIARLASRVRADPAPYTDEATIEFDLLGHRAALEATPRNVAILNNAISIRNKQKGIRLGVPFCSCGSHYTHYDVDGPNPMQKLCDGCGALVSDEQIRAVADAWLLKVVAELKAPPWESGDPKTPK